MTPPLPLIRLSIRRSLPAADTLLSNFARLAPTLGGLFYLQPASCANTTAVPDLPSSSRVVGWSKSNASLSMAPVNAGPQNAALFMPFVQALNPIVVVNNTINRICYPSLSCDASIFLTLFAFLLFFSPASKERGEQTNGQHGKPYDCINHFGNPICVFVTLRKYILPTLIMIVAARPANAACPSVIGNWSTYCNAAPALITTIEAALKTIVLKPFMVVPFQITRRRMPQ